MLLLSVTEQTPGGVNMYARTVTSYVSWKHAEGLAPGSAVLVGARVAHLFPEGEGG